MSEEIDNNLVSCSEGHVYELVEFTPPEECIACINKCLSEVPHAPAGLIYECGARVIWRRHWPVDKKKKAVRFRREKQLDLFWDSGLDKVSE